MKRDKVRILDANLAAFQHLNGNSPKLELNGGRVSFVFDWDERFNKLSSDYNHNQLVNVLDYVNSQRQLRAQMLALKMREK